MNTTKPLGPQPLRTSAVLVALVACAALAFASDPPHWTGPSLTITCGTQCHTLHAAPGGTLTQAASNAALCQSCHNSAGDAKRMPMDDAVKAVPGGGGSSHAFSVLAVNSAYGAGLPLDEEMKLRVACDDGLCDDDAERIANGKVTCSTCHNQHTATAAIGGTAHISQPQKVTGTDLGGTGAVSSAGTFSGTEGKWYHLQITVDDSNFIWRSFDDTTNAWSAWSSPDSNIGTGVALADGVTVSFDAGTFLAGEEFELFASFPFLRVPPDDPGDGSGSHMCMQCHSERDMDHATVETHGYGVDGVAGGGDDAFRSHPVGVSLNANSKGYDRSQPLDGDGSADDGNAFNDLAMDGNGNVHCLTCHGIHNAHSNTLSDGSS